MTTRPILHLLLLLTLLLTGCRAVQAAPINTATADKPAETITALPLALPSASPTPLQPTLHWTATVPVATAPVATAPVAQLTSTPTPGSEMVDVPAGRAVVPILMYHHISDESSTRYTVSIATFRQQMEDLKANGYQTISVSRLADVIRAGGKLPVKPVVLTFDDGYQDVYDNAFPILQELGYTGVAYIITGTLGTKLSYGYMQEKELKALANAGWEIGSHSITHNDLMKSNIGVGNEIQKSKEALEEMLGVKVRSFSYPFGAANQSIKELTAKLGYGSAVGIDISITHTPRRLYYLSRREVYRSLALEQFRALLQLGEADQYIDMMLTGTPTPAP